MTIHMISFNLWYHGACCAAVEVTYHFETATVITRNMKAQATMINRVIACECLYSPTIHALRFKQLIVLLPIQHILLVFLFTVT